MGIEYSDVVATIALVVSVPASLIALYRSFRWERPVVAVAGSWRLDGSGELFNVVLNVRVMNVGNHATQIVGVHWEMAVGRGRALSVMYGGWKEPVAGGPVPDLPVTLERNQLREWSHEEIFRVPKYSGERMRARPVVHFVGRRSVATQRGVRTNLIATDVANRS